MPVIKITMWLKLPSFCLCMAYSTVVLDSNASNLYQNAHLLGCYSDTFGSVKKDDNPLLKDIYKKNQFNTFPNLFRFNDFLFYWNVIELGHILTMISLLISHRQLELELLCCTEHHQPIKNTSKAILPLNWPLKTCFINNHPNSIISSQTYFWVRQ